MIKQDTKKKLKKSLIGNLDILKIIIFNKKKKDYTDRQAIFKIVQLKLRQLKLIPHIVWT